VLSGAVPFLLPLNIIAPSSTAQTIFIRFQALENHLKTNVDTDTPIRKEDKRYYQ